MAKAKVRLDANRPKIARTASRFDSSLCARDHVRSRSQTRARAFKNTIAQSSKINSARAKF